MVIFTRYNEKESTEEGSIEFALSIRSTLLASETFEFMVEILAYIMNAEEAQGRQKCDT